MFEIILVCLDGSELPEQILPLVEAEALKFNSNVILLQVVPYDNSNDNKVQKEHDHANIGKVNTYLDKISRLLQDKGIQVDVAVVNDEPVGKAIVDYAKDNRVDLIAIATHGHGGLERLMFGSVAEYILKESQVPLLVIGPKYSKQP